MRVATLIVLGLLVLATSAVAEKAPYLYPEVNVNVERQGGDTIADAVPLGTMPYSGAGTTVGYTDDYDEVCPYAGSTSPDVVYSWTACESGTLEFTLCAGSAYDTKLYIYDGDLNLVACNDDECPGWISELSVASGEPVDVVAGTLYYIVIDGYGGDQGDYTLDITGIECGTATEEATFSNVKVLYR